jgi:hypothetical protein
LSTVATPAARVRSAPIQASISADAVAIGSLGVLVAVLLALSWGAWGDLGSDTGYDIVAGARVAHGHFPYVSFVYYYGPLAPFLLGFAMLVGGGGLGPAVALGVAVACAIVLATYVLGRMHAGVVGGFFAAAITAAVAFAPTNFSFVMPHTYSVTLGLLWALCFLIAAGRYAQTNARRWLVATGGAAGLVAITRPELEVAVLAAAAVWLLLRVRARISGIGDLAVFAAPALGIPAAVYGTFLAWIPAHQLVLDNLLPTSTLRAGANNVYRAYAPLTASSFVALGAKLAVYGAGVLCLLALARVLARRGPARVAGWVLVATVGVAVVGASVARPETLRYYLQFAYGWIPAGAAIAVLVLLWRFRCREGTWTPAAQAELVGAAFLAVIAARVYGNFLPYATVPQLAVYAVPPAAVFMARLHLVELARPRPALALGALWLAFLAAAGFGLTLKDASRKSAWVRGPGGAVRVQAADAAPYRQVVSWLTSAAPPGRPVLVAPQLTALYVIADRPNPLRQISLLPGALVKKGATEAAIASLRRARVSVIVTDSRRYTEYDQTYFGGSFDRGLARWLRAHYVRDASLHGFNWGQRSLDVWVRRPR